MDGSIPLALATESALVGRARIVTIEPDAVVVADASNELRACDTLDIAETGSLAEGDEVLAWLPQSRNERGIVLGRVRRQVVSAAEEGTPDELVLEARHSLTLRVGDGSITIREDGKILIKGKDLVSHATQRNRIKGGSVQIN